MKTMAIILVNCFIWIACATSRKPETQSIGGKWELTMFPYSTKAFAELFGERRPTLQFSQDYKVSGNTGCNLLSGSYTKDHSNLSFSTGMGTTRMACAGYEENLFLEALARVNKSEIKHQQLNLYDGNRLLMVFTKSE